MTEEIIPWTNVMAALNAYAEEVQQLYSERLKADGHFATGNLINRLEYIVNSGMTATSVELNLEDYWKYLEYGTKPHFPPIETADGRGILPWVKVKKILPNNYNTKLPDNMPLDKLYRQSAYMIARSIAQKGTEASHNLEEALNEINTRYEEILSDAIEKDLDEGINGILISGFMG